MPQLPDLDDPRYLREVGWFVHHEKYGPYTMGNDFDEERTLFSEALMKEVLRLLGEDLQWLRDKTVVSVGCGCTGELATWPAAVKVGIDPLTDVYQRLGMMVKDAPATVPTVYLASGVEELPLLGDMADLVISRNSLDHMLRPEVALDEVSRILKPSGRFFLGVDVGGVPTPDEPTVFSEEALDEMMRGRFDILFKEKKPKSYATWRDFSVRMIARPRQESDGALDRDRILLAYEAHLAAEE